MPGTPIIAEHLDRTRRDFGGPASGALVSNNSSVLGAGVDLQNADEIEAVGTAGDPFDLHARGNAPIKFDETPGPSIWCTAEHTKYPGLQINWYTMGMFVAISWHTDLGVRLRRPRSSCSATPRKRGASMTSRTRVFRHGTSCPPRTLRFATLKPINQAKQKPFAVVDKTCPADGSRGCELMRKKRGA